MTFSIISSVTLFLVCGVVAWRADKITDAAVTLLSTLIAALLALATYQYGISAADDSTRDRLRRLLQTELQSTQKAVGVNAARWRAVERSGEASPTVDYVFAPKVVAISAFESGLFPNDEALLLDYLIALDHYNSVIESQLGAWSIGAPPGGSSSGLLARMVLAAASPVEQRAVELTERFSDSK